MEILNKQNIDLTLSPTSSKVSTLSPVAQGLMYWFDAKDNAGFGKHSNSATTWFNKGGNLANSTDRNATKIGSPTWGSDYLSLTAEGQGFFTGNIAPVFEKNAVTMESVITIPEVPSSTGIVCGNVESGGFSIRYNGKLYLSSSYMAGSTRNFLTVESSLLSEYVGKKCYVCARYSTGGGYLYVKGSNFEETVQGEYLGAVSISNTSTCFTIGYNGNVSGVYDSQQFLGKIHSIKCYAYALTDEEMAQNLAYERDRYGF